MNRRGKWGYQPKPKMVTNSFGNRNFMEAMGRLSMHSKCLGLFSLSFGLGRVGEVFFHFSFVLNMFSSSSKWVPIRFPMCSPRVFPIAPCFNPICFAQSSPLLTYVGGPKVEAFIFPQNLLFGVAWIVSIFLQWANQIGSLQNKKLNLGGTSQER